MSKSGYVANASMDKENLITSMPKLFGQGGGRDRAPYATDDENDYDNMNRSFSRPTSAGTKQQFSRPTTMMRTKARGLASRPSTANNTRETKDTNMSGGTLVSKNGENFMMIPKLKATGYKKYPKEGRPNFTSTTKSSYVDPSPSLRGTKKLEPYRPESARSRLPVRFKGEPKPFTRHCKPGNISQFSLGAPDADWESWKKKVVKRKRPVSAAH